MRETQLRPSSKMGEVTDPSEISPSSPKNITLEPLLSAQPEQEQLPFEPIAEYTIQGSASQPERQRLAINAQFKMNWENRCQRHLEFEKMW